MQHHTKQKHNFVEGGQRSIEAEYLVYISVQCCI